MCSLSRERTSAIPFTELPTSSPNPNPNPNPNPSPYSQKLKTTPCKQKENSYPQIVSTRVSPATVKFKSPVPPRPPPNPLKRKLYNDAVLDVAPFSSLSPDPGVRVVVRMRPLLNNDEKEEIIVQKNSNESLSSNGHTFTFVYDADANATSLIFSNVWEHLRWRIVWRGLIAPCLPMGSGKIFTMWEPANALLEGNLVNDPQGLIPRVFKRLFIRINEICNDQVTDLLNPRLKNLHIREDTNTWVYVENLTEECVSTMKDMIQLLLKGLANRRTGAASINAESSRSHSVFICAVESYGNGEHLNAVCGLAPPVF